MAMEIETEQRVAMADEGTAPAAPEDGAGADLPFDLPAAFDLAAIREQARAEAEAEARAEEEAAAPAPEPVAAAAPAPAPQAAPAEPVAAAPTQPVAQPAPAADSLADLRAEIAPDMGWDGRMERLQALADEEIDPYDEDEETDDPLGSGKKLTKAEAQKAAKAELRVLKRMQGAGDKIYRFVEDAHWRAMRDDLAGIPRVVEGVDAAALLAAGSLTEAGRIVAQAVERRWQERWDAREREFAGKLAQAEADGASARAARMGRALDPHSDGGASARPSRAEIFGTNGRLSESIIDRAKRGDFAGLDLSD